MQFQKQKNFYDQIRFRLTCNIKNLDVVVFDICGYKLWMHLEKLNLKISYHTIIEVFTNFSKMTTSRFTLSKIQFTLYWYRLELNFFFPKIGPRIFFKNILMYIETWKLFSGLGTFFKVFHLLKANFVFHNSEKGLMVTD